MYMGGVSTSAHFVVSIFEWAWNRLNPGFAVVVPFFQLFVVKSIDMYVRTTELGSLDQSIAG